MPDWDALTEALLAQRGRVAVSGYGDEWDHLGWQRHERTGHMRDHRPGSYTVRTEVVWTSYDPPQASLLEAAA